MDNQKIQLLEHSFTPFPNSVTFGLLLLSVLCKDNIPPVTDSGVLSVR